jgi:hypothetical protein
MPSQLFCNISYINGLEGDRSSQEQIDRVRPAAFIIHETGPGNRQAWIVVSGVPEGKEQFKEFTRRVRRAVGANDKSASHSTRLAGTENWKPSTYSILRRSRFSKRIPATS